MARVVLPLILVVLFAISVCAAPGKRTRRGFNNGGYNSGSSGGYGRGSDEDASVSGEGGGGCSADRSGNSGNSGSREVANNKDGRQQSNDNRRGVGARTFSKASASASSSSSYNPNQKSNIV